MQVFGFGLAPPYRVAVTVRVPSLAGGGTGGQWRLRYLYRLRYGNPVLETSR